MKNHLSKLGLIIKHLRGLKTWTTWSWVEFKNGTIKLD